MLHSFQIEMYGMNQILNSGSIRVNMYDLRSRMNLSPKLLKIQTFPTQAWIFYLSFMINQDVQFCVF